MPEQLTSDKSVPRILLVNDEPTVHALLRNILNTRYECDLFEASDGLEAQKILRGEEMDVVVADLTTPRMNGLSLLRWAKQEGRQAEWIILSGAGGFDEVVQAIHLGAFDYVSKPIDNVDELVITLRNAVRQRRLQKDRTQLMQDIERRNLQLAEQVAHLQEACRILTSQQEIIDADLRRSELIQRAMLPLTLPEVDRLAINTLYRPSHNVGGDLYDVVQLPSGHLSVYVADAAGHGISAAMLAVLFKHRIPLWDDQAEQPLAPSKVLENVNACLWDECKAPGLFMTVAYALIEPDGEHVTLASAGHPPTLLCRSDGRFEMLNGDAPALGINEHAGFPQRVIALEPGDRLLLYTDGLFTSLDPQQALTPEGLANLLASQTGDSQTMLDRVLDIAAERRRGHCQEDDITMVMLTFAETPSLVDNGQPNAEINAEAAPSFPTPRLHIGQDEEGTVICLRGRGCWTHSNDFYEICLQELCPDRPLTIDLSYCEYLDSTFLGTVQELVDQANREHMPIRFQGVPAAVQGQFEELGMRRVLAHLKWDEYHMPEDLTPVLYGNFSDRHQQQRVLNAHEALAELNEDNHREFNRLIDMLRKELEPNPIT